MRIISHLISFIFVSQVFDKEKKNEEDDSFNYYHLDMYLNLSFDHLDNW